MPKCEFCEKKDCKKCTKSNCTCSCGCANDGWFKTGVISTGLVYAGMGLLIAGTGGTAAVVLGGAYLGAGVSATIYGAQKVYEGEQVQASEVATTMAIGAVTGVISGGAGAAGETLAVNVTKDMGKEVLKVGATKLAVRAGAGAVGGAASGVAAELCHKGKDADMGRAACNGALAGAVGGAGSHASSAAGNMVSQGHGVVKAGVKAAVTGASSGGASAAVSYAETGKVDLAQAATAATVGAGVSLGASSVRNSQYAANGGKNAHLEKVATNDQAKKIASNTHEKITNEPPGGGPNHNTATKEHIANEIKASSRHVQQVEGKSVDSTVKNVQTNGNAGNNGTPVPSSTQKTHVLSNRGTNINVDSNGAVLSTDSHAGVYPSTSKCASCVPNGGGSVRGPERTVIYTGSDVRGAKIPVDYLHDHNYSSTNINTARTEATTAFNSANSRVDQKTGTFHQSTAQNTTSTSVTASKNDLKSKKA